MASNYLGKRVKSGDKYYMSAADLVIILISQVIVILLYNRGAALFRATKAGEAPPKKVDWAVDFYERMEARIEALQKRELENKERIWLLEDENTILRYKLIDAQKRAAGEPPEEPNYEEDEE